MYFQKASKNYEICPVITNVQNHWQNEIFAGNLSKRLLFHLKREFFQAVAMSVLLYSGNTWTLVIRLEKMLDEHDITILHVFLNKSWK